MIRVIIVIFLFLSSCRKDDLKFNLPEIPIKKDTTIVHTKVDTTKKVHKKKKFLNVRSWFKKKK